jgi:hypothetical protein
MQNNAGWFRTPIAAAMLCGVLNGAIAIASRTCIDHLRSGISYTNYYLMLFFMVVSRFCIFFAFLASASISNRRLRLLVPASRWALLVTIANALLMYFSIEVILKQGAVIRDVYFAALDGIQCWILTILLSRIYGLIPCPRKLNYIGFLCGLLDFGVSKILSILTTAMMTGATAEEWRAVNVMSGLVTNMTWVLIPSIFIEFELRKLAAAAASTSPATPATSPTESDASSAMR